MSHAGGEPRVGVVLGEAGDAEHGERAAHARRPARIHEEWAALARKLEVKVIHIAERDTQVSTGARRVGNSATPGQWPVSRMKACSPRNWAGAAMRSTGRTMRGVTVTAATLQSTWSARASPRACSAGRRWKGPTTASSLHTRSRFRSRITSRCAAKPARWCTGLRCTMPTIPAMTRCCRCMNSRASSGRCNRTNASCARRSLRAWTKLGVLLCGNPRGVYWYGSRLTIEQARELAPYNNATSLQVVAGIGDRGLRLRARRRDSKAVLRSRRAPRLGHLGGRVAAAAGVAKLKYPGRHSHAMS